MREPDALPNPKAEAKESGKETPIGGHEFLIVPDDDKRWHDCANENYPPNLPLPVIFFEVIAKRLSITDDLLKFLHNMPLPISIRRHFKSNIVKLQQYVNQILEQFPAIINRAGYLADDKAIMEQFVLDFEKEDLASFYAKEIQNANPKDVPVIGAALSKLNGWDAPEKHQVETVSEVRHILDDISSNEKRIGSNFCPLPPPESTDLTEIEE